MNNPTVRLGDHSFITKLAGFEHTKYIQNNATHKVDEVPMIQGKNIVDGRVNYVFDWYITKNLSDKLQRSVLNKKSIVIPYVGSRLGELAVFENDFRCHLASNVAKVELTDDAIDLRYLYYYLRSAYGQAQLFKYKQGSAQPNITMEAIRDTEVIIYDKKTQKGISDFLSNLDKKIELNRQIDNKLETMAKTLYNYWFVQFDFPNNNGKPYKSSGGLMVWNNELQRDIPKNWNVGSLFDIANYINGLPCQKYRPKDEKDSLKVIKIREMREGFSEDTELVQTNIPKKNIVMNGDVLFSWSASLEIQIWAGGKGGLNQHIFKVTSDQFPKYFFFFQISDYINHFRRIAEARKTTMGHITLDHLKQSRIAIPPMELIEELDKLVTPILDKISLLKKQNLKLKKLRDELLPMLINGQITVEVQS